MKELIDNFIQGIEDSFSHNFSEQDKACMAFEFTGTIYKKLYPSLIYNRMEIIVAEETPSHADLFDHLDRSELSGCTMVGDFSNYTFDGIRFFNVTFDEKSKLPTSKNFFKQLHEQYGRERFHNTVLSFVDLNNYDLDGCRLDGLIFSHDSILPKDRDFFQKLPYKSLREITLPRFNMNDYNFEGVHLENVVFTPDTIMSNDKNFFQKLHSKSIKSVSMPVHDYSSYKFADVDFTTSVFREGSKLPELRSFLQRLKGKSIAECTLPEMDLNCYNLDGVKVYGTIFHKNTKLPNDSEFISRFSKKEMMYCIMPLADYTTYSFKGTKLSHSKFPHGSILPRDIISQLGGISYETDSIAWPEQFLMDVILPLNPTRKISLKRCDIPYELLTLLHAKFKNNNFVELPPLPDVSDIK